MPTRPMHMGSGNISLSKGINGYKSQTKVHTCSNRDLLVASISIVGTFNELKATRICIDLENTTVSPQEGLRGER